MANIRVRESLREIGRLFDGGTLGDRSDADLLARFANVRDESAFAALVERHGPTVIAACRAVLRDRNDTEDALQATFLVLARKAGSIQVDGSLGGWLYRVAFRVALQANNDAIRRRARERQAGEEAAMRHARDQSADSRHPPLFEEIDRLPDRYRAPIVLCYLEGLTQEAAAARIGMSEGTFRRRLAQARTLLRARLTRAGVPMTAGALIALLAQQASGAALPVAWGEATVRGAMAASAGRFGTGSAAIWASRVLRAMLSGRRLWVGAMALGIAVGGSGTAIMLTLVTTSRSSERLNVGSRPSDEPKSTPGMTNANGRSSNPGLGKIFVSGQTENLGRGAKRTTLVIDPDRGGTREQDHPPGSLNHWRAADGSILAWLTADGANSVLWSRDPGGRVRPLLEVPIEAVVHFVFSPDGRQAIVSRGDGGPRGHGPETWRIDRDQAAQLRLPQPGAVVVDWSPDGTRLLVITTEAGPLGSRPLNQLLLTDTQGSDPQLLRTGYIDGAKYAPDGRRIAVMSRAEGGCGWGVRPTLSIMEADGSTLRPILTLDQRALERLCWSPDGERLALQLSDVESGPDGSNRIIPGSRRIEIATADGRQRRQLDLLVQFEGMSELEWR